MHDIRALIEERKTWIEELKVQARLYGDTRSEINDKVRRIDAAIKVTINEMMPKQAHGIMQNYPFYTISFKTLVSRIFGDNKTFMIRYVMEWLVLNKFLIRAGKENQPSLPGIEEGVYDPAEPIISYNMILWQRTDKGKACSSEACPCEFKYSCLFETNVKET